MRKIIILPALFTVLLLAVAFSVNIALASARPFHPWDMVFPFQDFAEQSRAWILISDTQRASYFLDLTSQRTEDLLVAAGTYQTERGIDSLDKAFTQAIAGLAEVPESKLENLGDQVNDLLLRMDLVLQSLSGLPPDKVTSVQELQAKVAFLQDLLMLVDGGSQVAMGAKIGELQVGSGRSTVVQDPSETGEIPPLEVLFPPGSPGALHEFYPLVGEHSELECSACHSNGQYSGTPNLCMDCHLEEKPLDHYDGDCATCHTPFSWQEVNFDHSAVGTEDCLTCHAKDQPAGHYAAQCSACHNTINWTQVDFNHQAVNTKDCQSCHSPEKPSKHYSGQCSACHNTSNWRQANFNHQAVRATDCVGCHSGRKPANHYGGQCSACHNTTNWSQAKFNHQVVGATDCVSCHQGRKPANHYNGQCSACHSTSSWSGARFNHGAAGATDCKACHSGRKPANHYGGQCSACHSTKSWSGATFNHSAAGATDCKACHSGKKPANHFDGQCSQCHTTSSWGGASFNHSFPMNHGNANGDCSKCHPSGGSQYNCFACHDKDKMINKHNEKGITDIAGRCLNCHPGGRGGDGD